MRSSSLIRPIAVAAVATLGLTLAASAAHAADPVAPSFDLAVPTTVHAGGAAQTFTGHLSTPEAAQDIWVRTSITGADADDVTVEWKNQDGVWAEMPETAIENGIQVTFGDGDADGNHVKGFSTYPGYSADTDFRIAVDHDAAHGSLAWTSEIVTGDAGTLVASTSGTVAISADPTFTMNVPSTLITGAAASGFSGHLSASDAAQDIWVRTSITGAAADDVTIEWKRPDGVWEPMHNTPIDDGIQVGFGNGDADQNGVTGFPVGAGYAADTEFRIAVAAGAPIGTLTWVSELVTGNEGTVLRSTTGTVNVDLPVAPKASIGTRTDAVVYGKDVRFSGTLLDANHANAPLAGETVTVFREVAGQAPVPFTTTTTDANGAFSVLVTANESATYWAEAGDQQTAKLDVTVAKQLSAVSVSRKHAHRGQPVRFTGDVVSPVDGQPVLLQIQRANGSWKNLATANANRSGAFKVGSALVRGERTYRVAVTGSDLVGGDTSKPFVVRVK